MKTGKKQLFAQIFLILFCLSHFLPVFTNRADASCQEYKADMEYWERRIEEIDLQISIHTANGAMKSVGTGALIGGASGAVIGAVRGGISGAAAGGVGAVPGALTGGLLGGLTGMIAGGIVGYKAYYDQLNALKAQKTLAEFKYMEAWTNYQMHKHEGADDE